MKSTALVFPLLYFPSVSAFVLETRRNAARNNIRTPPSLLFSSFTSPDWMIPPIIDDSTEHEDLLSDRMERENKPDGTVTMLSAATGVILSLVLMMAAMGGNDSTTIGNAPSATSIREESAPKQERVYKAPEMQEEGSSDYLIDQSAGFFFY